MEDNDRIIDHINAGREIYMEQVNSFSIPINEAVERVLLKHGIIKKVDGFKGGEPDLILLNEINDEIQYQLEREFGWPDYHSHL